MTERDRLIDLLTKVQCEGDEERGNCPERRHTRCWSIDKLEMCQINAIADYLLAAGVIVPPLKVEPTVEVYREKFDYYNRGKVVLTNIDVIKETRYKWSEATRCKSEEEAERLERELAAEAKRSGE